jgi:hypothetical protein
VLRLILDSKLPAVLKFRQAQELSRDAFSDYVVTSVPEEVLNSELLQLRLSIRLELFSPSSPSKP